MTKPFRRGALALPATMMTLTGTAWADVTPQDVWAQWTAYMASFGYELENDPIVDGANLRLPDFSMAMPVPADPSTGKEGGIVRFRMGDIALIDQGDGTVSVEVPASTPISIIGESVGAENFVVRGTMTSAGYRTVASGQPGDILYDFNAGSITFTLDDLTEADGQTKTPGEFELSLQGAAGQSRMNTLGGPTQMDQTLTLARVTYAFDIPEIDGADTGHLKAEGELMGVTTTTTGTIPATFDPAAVPQALSEGYAMKADMGYTTGRSSFDFAEDGKAMRFASTSEGGTFTVGMAAAGLVYEIAARGIDFSLEGSDIPFPIATTLAGFDLGVDLPVLKGDAPQDFTARLKLTDLTVPEPLWMMIDAAGALPHDPLTAEIETSGKARLFVDVFDEDATAALVENGRKPGEVTTLNLDSLLLKAGGATIAATGAFDVDNNAQSAFNPKMPAFAGQVDLRLTGVTTLISTLSQMGLIPAPQAMMASGMIQQLGKPETGPDDVSALIEVSKESRITINGAPLPF
ncbi:DUF2125 domain-containing protein [Pseudooceanicola onchidii]|uniref:DUF2125 domain-containing protein n=1 Tax=Pseudooceanicola onchidii TaxID=2562279 RepID=UPI0010AA6FAC|nr:DUF2125 domain-containing protein [Pseudooceanicola onchidii]